MDKIKIIFDIGRVAEEIFCYIVRYTLEESVIPSNMQFTRSLEELLFKLTVAHIEKNIHPWIRDNQKCQIAEAYLEFCHPYFMDPVELESIIEDMLSFRYITDKITECMEEDTFELWSLTKVSNFYIFESSGDYRILEWEQQHVIDGKFIR